MLGIFESAKVEIGGSKVQLRIVEPRLRGSRRVQIKILLRSPYSYSSSGDKQERTNDLSVGTQELKRMKKK